MVCSKQIDNKLLMLFIQSDCIADKCPVFACCFKWKFVNCVVLASDHIQFLSFQLFFQTLI